MFQYASSQSDARGGGRYRSLLRIVGRIWPRGKRDTEKGELLYFVSELLKGCQDNEEKALLLANWTTIAIRDEPQNGSGVIATFRERKVRSGSLAQLASFYPLAYVNQEVANRIDDFICSKGELFPRGWFSTPSSVEAYAVRLGLEAAMERRR